MTWLFLIWLKLKWNISKILYIQIGFNKVYLHNTFELSFLNLARTKEHIVFQIYNICKDIGCAMYCYNFITNKWDGTESSDNNDMPSVCNFISLFENFLLSSYCHKVGDMKSSGSAAPSVAASCSGGSANVPLSTVLCNLKEVFHF